MVNWSEHTKRTLPFNCSNTTPDKTEARKARRRVLIIGKARIMGKARRREGAQGAQFSRVTWNEHRLTDFPGRLLKFYKQFLSVTFCSGNNPCLHICKFTRNKLKRNSRLRILRNLWENWSDRDELREIQADLVKIYLFKFNNRNTRKRFEICLKLTIKTPKRCH